MSIESSRYEYHVGLESHQAGEDLVPKGQENEDGDRDGDGKEVGCDGRISDDHC